MVGQQAALPSSSTRPSSRRQGGPGWSRIRDDAIRFLSREAEVGCHATPAEALLRPDGTLNWPLSVYQAALKYEPPGLPPVAQNPRHQSLLEQVDLDGAQPVGLEYMNVVVAC
jgi:hypothetical protein